MARPTETIKGFIEVSQSKINFLLSIHNIAGVALNGDKALIILNTSLNLDGKTHQPVDQSYREVCQLIKQAV